MEVKVNRKVIDIPMDMGLVELLSMLGLSNWVTVIINEKSILQGDYSQVSLKGNDDIIIIKPLGGG